MRRPTTILLLTASTLALALPAQAQTVPIEQAEEQAAATDAPDSTGVDPTSEVSRFEQKIRREEARVRGAEELQASSLDAQFESLEALGQQSEVEARLAALKSRSAEKIVSAEEV